MVRCLERNSWKNFLPIVQCRPFQPLEQMQVPFLHCPCWLHLESHGSWSHLSPVQPDSHEHRPRSQNPWGPQFRWQRAKIWERNPWLYKLLFDFCRQVQVFRFSHSDGNILILLPAELRKTISLELPNRLTLWTIWASPKVMTNTLSSFQIISAMIRTSG